jgi:hypothetical protein
MTPIVYAFITLATSYAQDMGRSMRPPPLFPTNGWGAVTNDCQVGLRLPKFEYELGEPIIAFLYLRNVGIEQIGYTSGGTDADYEIIVRHADGRIAEYTKQWQSVAHGSEGFSSRGETLQPHKQELYPGWLNVSERYKLDQPGKYTITARRHLYLSEKVSSGPDKGKDVGAFDVLSNPVTITVVAPGPTKPEK